MQVDLILLRLHPFLRIILDSTPGSERDNAAEKGQELHSEKAAKHRDGKMPSHRPFGIHCGGILPLALSRYQ